MKNLNVLDRTNPYLGVKMLSLPFKCSWFVICIWNKTSWEHEQFLSSCKSFIFVSQAAKQKISSLLLVYIIFEINIPVERECKFSQWQSEFTAVGKPPISFLSSASWFATFDLIASICNKRKLPWSSICEQRLHYTCLHTFVMVGTIWFNVDTFSLAIVLTVV